MVDVASDTSDVNSICLLTRKVLGPHVSHVLVLEENIAFQTPKRFHGFHIKRFVLSVDLVHKNIHEMEL